jgi:hypothetical protein
MINGKQGFRAGWLLALNRQSEMRYDSGDYTFSGNKARIELFNTINNYINNAITLAPPEKSALPWFCRLA